MLHIIQNDPEVPAGTIGNHLTIPYVVHHPYRGDPIPEIERIAALIVLGGSMGANDDNAYPFLVEIKGLIRKVVAAEIPYLGICLGGQLLAAALGATVVSHRWEELGMLPAFLTSAGERDLLFAGIGEQFATFQWHHDSFDIPEGAVLLASSAGCPHQAFRVGRCVWGVQFHPEVTETIIRDWCAWDLKTAESADECIAAFSSMADAYQATSRKLCDNFLRISSGSAASPALQPGS